MTFRRGEAAHLAAAAATERHVTYNDKVQYKVSDLCVVSFANILYRPESILELQFTSCPPKSATTSLRRRRGSARTTPPSAGTRR